MRSRSAAAAVLAATGAAFAALAVWSTAARSAIPLEWHGTVTAVEVRHEKHPGVDDAWFVSVDGDETHVDRAVAALVRPGARVDKERWARTLRVDGVAHRLAYTDEARRMVVVAPAIAAAAALVAVYPGASWTRVRTR